jgi:hypothetical protein
MSGILPRFASPPVRMPAWVSLSHGVSTQLCLITVLFRSSPTLFVPYGRGGE